MRTVKNMETELKNNKMRIRELIHESMAELDPAIAKLRLEEMKILSKRCAYLESMIKQEKSALTKVKKFLRRRAL